MWKPIHDPGPWKAFLGRKDIKSLPIMEARKIYLQEQLLFESYLNNLSINNTVSTTSAVAASAGAAAGAGGGRRKLKAAAQYRLTLRGSGLSVGIYDRVAISDLRRYWVDNGLGSVPLPQIPSNIGSDYFFIRETVELRTGGKVSLITWGSLGRGRQRRQWTYSEYNVSSFLPIGCNEYYGRWLYGFGFGFGSSDLSTPAGKWEINRFSQPERGRSCITTSDLYELTEFKPTPLPETINFAREDGTTDDYTGTYSRNGVDENGNPTWIFQGGSMNAPSIYYSTACVGWKVDRPLDRQSCLQRINLGSVDEDSPLGTYTTTINTRPPSSIRYIATEG